MVATSTSPGRGRRWPASALALGAVLAAGLAIAGCTAPGGRQAGPVIQVSGAQIMTPGANGVTDVYLDVQNSGPADKIIAASISSGGHITLRAPVRTGEPEMRTVSSITIPADSSLGLDPNGEHLLVTGTGHMIAGHEITLTVVFAHAGRVSTPLLVTNPQSGGASYFLDGSGG